MKSKFKDLKFKKIKTRHGTNLIPFHKLRDLYSFKFEDPISQEGWVLDKVSDAMAIDRSGHDFILAPTDMVEPLYPLIASKI